MKFAERLKELRKEKGITQEALSKELHVNRNTVKGWEASGKEPSFATLCAIARFFDVSTDYLLGMID